MTIIKIVLAILNIAVTLVENISKRRLIKAGEDAILVKSMEDANDRIKRAIYARRAIVDSMPSANDPYIRN